MIDDDDLGTAAPPRVNGELVFAAPWERRLFGITLALHEAGVFAWDDFRALLVDEITCWEAQPGAVYHYYEHWERALGRLVAARGLVDSLELARRVEILNRRPAGHDHDHDHDH